MSFDFDVIARSLPFLWQGFRYTVELTLIATLGGLIFGTLLALARLGPSRILAGLAAGYVNLMRSIPLVLVLLWLFFLMPQVLQVVIGSDRPPRIGAEWTAIITFILFEAAYFCEIMRAGIQSIPLGQRHAAYALGLGPVQTLLLVVLPQAVRSMLPVLLTQVIILFQDTSLVYVISAPDFTGVASKIAQRDGRLIELYLFVAVVYLLICSLLSYGVKRLQRKIAVT